ncbi:MAG: NAD(P)(+) transhydrogenase (Re/Si-specific) subunit beta [Chitinophagales bacterium]|nr:NAD(P)(+) transhydrogenase (Re/Si-specific) subunit beta [Chitinophagales bacterium]
MNTPLILSYLIGSITFVVGLKMLSHPDTARRGNLLAAFGMVVAIIATIFLTEHHGEGFQTKLMWIFAGIAIGTVAGWITAKRVEMTKMPELVCLFNGMGGACAALIGLMEYEHNIGNTLNLATIIAGMIIGSISFSGSIVAFLKLNGTMNKPIRLPFYNIINSIVMIAVIAFSIWLVATGQSMIMVYALFALAVIYGLLFVFPIGGADMPVVISLLNSFTGLAAAFGGFLYGNQVMLTGGILVGSAGTILTFAMCKAMNRPLSNVIFGAFGGGAGGAAQEIDGSIKDISIYDTAVLCNYASKVTIVPGYGLAVAQAQHIIHELEKTLEAAGVEVKYAIHPVAGRMPGHMNVLLAESNVAYEKLVEMDDINPEFPNTDVVIVVGANDVVNPAAKTDPASPIFGMPILDVEQAKHIIVNKRSMNAGYAGIDNHLFYNPKTSMLFGDAKDVLTKLVAELKAM